MPLIAHYPGPSAWLPLANAVEHVGFRPPPEPSDLERWQIYKAARWARNTTRRTGAMSTETAGPVEVGWGFNHYSGDRKVAEGEVAGENSVRLRIWSHDIPLDATDAYAIGMCLLALASRAGLHVSREAVARDLWLPDSDAGAELGDGDGD